MESTKNDVKTLFLQLVRHWVTALIGYCCTPSGLSVARSRGVMVLFRERTTKSAKNTKNLDFSEARSYRVWAPHPRRSWTLHRLIPGKIEINFHRLKSVEIGWNLPVLWTLMVKKQIGWNILTDQKPCMFDPPCIWSHMFAYHAPVLLTVGVEQETKTWCLQNAHFAKTNH